MKIVKLGLGLLALLIVSFAVTAGVLLATFDANAYRQQISETLTEKLGRKISLEGPIKLTFSIDKGFALSVRDAKIANPAWASRPLMAEVGELDLGVRFLPLLRRSFEVANFKIAKADVLLETNASGKANWDLGANGASKQESGEPKATDGQKKAPLSISVEEVKALDSRIGIRGKDGKITTVNVQSLSFSEKGNETVFAFAGDVADIPLKLELTGEALDKMMGARGDFTADFVFDEKTLHAKGSLNNGAKGIVVEDYIFTAGETRVYGQMKADLSGTRPAVQGTLNSEKLDFDDLKMGTKAKVVAETPKEEPKAETKADERVFSTEPLNFDSLKAADVKLDVKIDEMPVGLSTFKDVQTKLNLENGRALMSPVSAMLADSKVEGQVKLDASSSSAQAQVLFKAYQLDMSQLVHLLGLESFIVGKADTDMDISTYGRSLHEFAGNANGHLSFIMAGGSLSQSTLSDIGNSLLNVFAPGTGGLKPEMNCMVAKFKIESGKVQSEGLLMDTSQATVAGYGGADLGDETVDMVIRSRAKALSIDQYTPALRVSGALKKPKYNVDVRSSVEKAAGALLGQETGDGGVPQIVTQAGQNACVYTLEHLPAKASKNAIQENVNKAKEKIKDVGGKIMNKLFGK